MIPRSIPLRHQLTRLQFSFRMMHSEGEIDLKSILHENDQDKEWIKSNVAYKSLALGSEHPTHHITESSMIKHLSKRGYEPVLNTPQAVRTLSSLFTFPTSLAYGINKIFPVHRENLSVCIVGARAEHSLPRSWWLETLISCPNISSLNIVMVGPGIVHSPSTFQKDSIIKWNASHKLPQSTEGAKIGERIVTIKTPKNGHTFLHDHPDVNTILLQTDVFVLFHPGLGSEAHRANWEHTLRLLLETRKPILGTAHGGKDLQTDVNAVIQLAQEEDWQDLGDPLEFIISPQMNPYRSLKRVLFEDQIIVNNHSIYAFQAK